MNVGSRVTGRRRCNCCRGREFQLEPGKNHRHAAALRCLQCQRRVWLSFNEAERILERARAKPLPVWRHPA